jgi:superfamily I DNA/RNA helicase
VSVFFIADTFTDSLARLTADEQKAAKTTAFDLQMNPASPGLSFHRLDKAKDKNFWSVRVNADVRLIVHRTPGSLLLCYVDHHDRAYVWAERRKLETHPKTGAAQLVEIRETVKEIVVPVFTPTPVAKPKKPALFDGFGDDELLGFGVPAEWMKDVRAADEDSILTLATHLPAEAAEALLEIATGGMPNLRGGAPPPALPVPVEEPAALALALAHPDAQRRFRVMTSVEELQRALDAPWDKWTVFLHPEQREWVERDSAGPARVSGSAGTGKTIVALHRAVHLARSNPDARVLLTTFSDPLANALETRLRRLVGNEPRLRERIEVYALDALGVRLHHLQPDLGPVIFASRKVVRDLLRDASAAVGGHKFTLSFLMAEWGQIVDAWQLDSWEAYRDVARLGRKTRLPEAQRATLWKIFDRVATALRERKLKTRAGVFQALATSIASGRRPPFDFAVVDEAQDISVTQLRFFAALGADRPNALFFAGDLGQRIFQTPFSWRSLGVDIRGRSRTLRVNYRTSHQIRQQADRLLGPEISDVDGNRESRRDAISVFNGPPPSVRTFATEQEEIEAVSAWLTERLREGVQASEIGIFVRSASELPRAQAAADKAGLAFRILDEKLASSGDMASIGAMHLAKGLEFRVVAVMGCDDEVLPLQERIENVGDDADLQDVYDTERHLLYVACTRARDALSVTAVEPASEFLADLVQAPRENDVQLSHYEELGLEPTATSQEIEDAYKAAAKKLHPDANPGHERWAEAQMKRLNLIREVLADATQRAQYDASLRAGRAKGQQRTSRPASSPAEAPASWRTIMHEADAARQLMARDAAEGARSFEQLFRRHGDDPMIHFMRGKGLAAGGLVEEARAALTKAASGFPLARWKAAANAELAKLAGKQAVGPTTDRAARLKEVVDCLNAQKIRATYGAIGKVCGIEAKSVGMALGERRPWASWVVNASTGEPTGYKASEKHPDLYVNARVIADPEALRRLLADCG